MNLTKLTLLSVLASAAAPAFADPTIFNSIPTPIPPNVASEGPEAYAYAQIGDGIVFPAGTGGALTKIAVVLSSWACTGGNWYTAGTCVTSSHATFNQPITMNIYALDYSTPAQPKAGMLLGTVTQTFQIPYRPSSDTIHCPAGQQWYDQSNGQCYHGLAVPITFDFSHQNISITAAAAKSPSNTNGIVIGIEFNTTTAGPSPIGLKPCHSTAQGCPYDSLNVSTDGDVFFGTGFPFTPIDPTSSSVIDPNGVFFSYIQTGNACNKSTTLGVFEDDTVPNNGEPATETCFTGYHPEIQITAHCGDGGDAACPSVIGGSSVPLPPGP